MERTKFEKWRDDDGNDTHTLTLPDGQKFEKVPMELGLYLNKVEREYSATNDAWVVCRAKMKDLERNK